MWACTCAWVKEQNSKWDCHSLDVLDCKFVQKWAKEHIEAILPEFFFCNSCEVFHDYSHIHLVHGSSQLCELLLQVDAHSNLGNLLKAQGLTHHVSLNPKIFSDKKCVSGNYVCPYLIAPGEILWFGLLLKCNPHPFRSWKLGYLFTTLEMFFLQINICLANRHTFATWRQYGFNLHLPLHGLILQDCSWRQENFRKP